MINSTICSKGCARRATRRGLCRNCYEKQRVRQHAYGRWTPLTVDAEPVRAHVEQLRAAGLGLRRISEIAGVDRKIPGYLIKGRPDRGHGPSKTILARNAERLLAVPIPALPHQGGVADHQLVASTGTVRRLQALVAYGYPRAYIADRLGIHRSNATRLFEPEHARVLAATARKADALFRELQLTPGASVRARNEGKRRGWPLPLAWDEDTIDDPNSEPDTTAVPRATFTERYTELRDLGYSDDDIARRFGITLGSLERQLYRHQLRAAS